MDRTLLTEYFSELSQKYGDAIVEFSSGCTRSLPLGDFRSASGDEFFTV